MSLVMDPQDASRAADGRTPLAVVGPYHLLERVGAGALGEVFRARDTIHGRTVAVKRVPSALSADAARAAALGRAASAAATISHPGVAMLYECGVYDGGLYVVQEFVPGQTLTQMLAGRPIHPRRAVELAVEIADALTAVHAAGLIHGDLRPANVVVTPKGHVKLLDAGLASFTAGGAIHQTAAARAGALPDTTRPVLRYLSPEQALGEGGDGRSDLFAAGSVLFEMLTGQPAFERPTADETLVALLGATPAPPSATQGGVPAALDGIVARALSKSLDRRYQTAMGLADDLRAVKGIFDLEVADRPLPEPAPARSRVALWIAVGLAVLVGLAVWQRAQLASLF
jgi:serine/threonine protein kinase